MDGRTDRKGIKRAGIIIEDRRGGRFYCPSFPWAISAQAGRLLENRGGRDEKYRAVRKTRPAGRPSEKENAPAVNFF